MSDIQNIDYDKIIKIVKEAAQLFGDSALTANVTVKGPADFVTEVDKSVQAQICSRLTELYPQVQFMGEEKDNRDIDFSKPCWILDPVDGTTNLIHDFKNSSVSLALADGGEVVAGIIYNPYRDELFSARKGQGAFLNGKPIHVSAAPNLASSLVSVGTAPYSHEYADTVFSDIKAIFLRAQDIRRTGSAAIDLANVACGRTDAFFEQSLKPWDFAAGILLVAEACGRTSDYSGAPLSPTAPTSVLVTNGRIHEEMLEILERHDKI